MASVGLRPAPGPAIVRGPDRTDIELRESLRRYVERRLPDRDDGEDLVQETYVRLYAYRRSRTVADVGAFCFAVARNLLRDHARQRARAPIATELDETIACPQPRIDTVLEHRERVAVMVAALGRMPPLRREVLLRRRLDGIAVAEIGRDLDMSIAAIEKHCSRALADLRRALARAGMAA